MIKHPSKVAAIAICGLILGVFSCKQASMDTLQLASNQQSPPNEASNTNSNCINEDAINRFVKTEASRSHAVEKEDRRKVSCSDLDKDGHPEWVVLYMLEGYDGTNLWRQYLAILNGYGARGGKKIAQELVGEKSYRLIRSLSVSQGTIVLDALTYAPSDGSCCPSKQVRTSFIFIGHSLKEQKLDE